MARDLLEGYNPKDLLEGYDIPSRSSAEPAKPGYLARNWNDIVSETKNKLRTIADIGTGFKGGVEKITHGLVQPLAERGYLGENVQQGFRPMVERNQQELAAAEERRPYATGFGKFLGAAGVRAPAYAATGGGLPALGAIGGAYGAASLPEEGGSRLYNAGEEALTDMALGLLGKGIKNAPGFVKSFSGKSNAEKILADKGAIQKQYNQAYNSLFDKAKAHGLGQDAIKAPKLKVDNVIKNSSKTYNQSLKDFLKEPTLESAHKAQSDLGKFVERMNKLEVHNPLTSSQYKALEEAMNAQKKIRGSLFSEFNKRGGKDLALEYQNITKGYKQDVVPYLGNKTIKDLEKGKIKPSTAANKLAKDEAFNIATNNKYSDLQRSLLASNIFKKAIPATGVLGGISYGLNELANIIKGK